MEEEGARRRAYNGPGGAGARGYLHGLNEDDEEEEIAAEKAVVDVAKHRQAKKGPGGDAYDVRADQGAAHGRHHRAGGAAVNSTKRRAAPANNQGGAGGFELDLGNATLIGRRHRNVVEPSPLGKASPTFADAPGSPMRGVQSTATY
jgi:hypothetical protein